MNETYPDDLCEIGDIPSGTVLRDWMDDGIRILILRGPFHPCVYLGIPEKHPLAGYGYDDVPIQCHGGLTFADYGDGKWRPKGYYWFGYDYGHCDDFMFSEHSLNERGKKWTLKEIKSDSWGAVYDLSKIMRLSEKIAQKGLGWK